MAGVLFGMPLSSRLPMLEPLRASDKAFLTLKTLNALQRGHLISKSLKFPIFANNRPQERQFTCFMVEPIAILLKM